MKARVILADDDQDALYILQKMIQPNPLLEIVGACTDGEQLIDTVLSVDAQIVLLDINMPKMNGIDAAKAIRRIRPKMKLIFTTSYDEYAVEAFELNAVDYIVKPIMKARLYEALNKAIVYGRETGGLSRLRIRSGGSILYLDTADILFIEKVGKKCVVVTEKAEYQTYDTIRNVLEQLDQEKFFMTHRSYIVNLTRIYRVTPINDTYLIHFQGTARCAHLSKLKFDEMQQRFD